MVTLAATALEGGGTPSDTLDQQHGSPLLPLEGGGRTFSDTAGQQHGGPPASVIYVIVEISEEGVLPPWRGGIHRAVANIGGGGGRGGAGRERGRGVGGNYIKQ